MNPHVLILNSLITYMEGDYFPIASVMKKQGDLSIGSDDNRVTVIRGSEYYNATVNISFLNVGGGNRVKIRVASGKPRFNLEQNIAVVDFPKFLESLINKGVEFPNGNGHTIIQVTRPSLSNVRDETEFLMKNLLTTAEMSAKVTDTGIKVKLNGVSF